MIPMLVFSRPERSAGGDPPGCRETQVDGVTAQAAFTLVVTTDLGGR
jgi:hypothetical protein